MFCEEVKTFIRTQLTYARQARDNHLMHSPDENGQLPLHRALRDNVTLGSIKLLVKGNPSAVRCPDNRGMIPLHIACQHHESDMFPLHVAFQHNDSASTSIVEYLLDRDPSTSRALDFDDNTVLHYACRDANHAIIGLLLVKYGSMSVSKRNTNNQLPIHLLLESNEVSNREDIKYTESIYRLLRANPETIINSII
jgi:ankyrin repeat protein